MKLALLLLFVVAQTLCASESAQTTTTSGDEPDDIILGFRGRSKYQIGVPDVAAETSLTRVAENLRSKPGQRSCSDA